MKTTCCRLAILVLAFSALLSALPLTAQSSPPVKESPDAARLNAFYTAEWQYQLEHQPEMATYVGDSRYNDRLGDYSADEETREAAHDQAQLRLLRSLPHNGLTEQEQISRELMLRQLQLSLDSYHLKDWEMPVNQMAGAYLDLAALYSQMPFNTARDYTNYIARMRAVPRVLSQQMDVMRLGMRDHLMPPRYLLQKVAAQAQSIANDAPDKSPFATPLQNFPASISATERQQIRTQLLQAISQSVLPSYVRFATFVRTTYAPAGRTEPGIWALPNGAALYRLAIREHVSTTLTPEQIHDEGLRQVAEIEKQMLQIAHSQGYNDLTSFNKHILSSPQFYATSAQQLLDLYQKYENQSRSKILEVVPTAPTLPLQVVPMDSFRAPTAVPADYSPGSIAGGRPGRVNVNLYEPKKRLLLNVEAIAYHEGMPGHHLQFSYADGLKGLPAFRRFSSYDAYSEGWAFYAERLGYELGFYHDPYSEYGRLQNEMWRSIRLIVDTGVHQEHWSRQQMVDFFRAHTAMDDQNIQTEVDRYIAWPGQALSYRLGQMKILELRARAKTALGPRFDIRQFHQRILELGPVPLDVMDECVQSWINQQLAAK